MKHKSRRNKSSARNRRKNNDPDKKQINPVEEDEINDGDLKGINQWIGSLTFDSLVNALEFTFESDGSTAGDHRQQEYNGDSEQRGNSGSHEFDLLIEMLSLQCQNPSGQRIGGFNEVENCHGWRRHMKAKLDTPYLFRWDDQDSEKQSDFGPKAKLSSLDEPESEVPSADRLDSLFTGTTVLPSELLDVLAKAGVKRSTPALLETFNEVDETDNRLESLEDGQNTMTKIPGEVPHLTSEFRVRADQGIADDGASLGRGSTVEQQNADNSMLQWTDLIWDRSLGTGEETNPDKSRSTLARCALSIPATKNEPLRKKLILDTLHVASRGNFLSKAANRRHSYVAPWFDPTQQWFSLPMYLTSRFEASLWDVYMQRDKIMKMSDEPKNNSLVQSVKNLDGDAIERVLCHALGIVIKDDISQKENSESCTIDSVQNTLLWKLLSWCDSGSVLLRAKEGPGGFATSPLLEWGTPLGELKLRVMDHLQEGLAHEAERSLIQSIPAGESEKSKANKKKKKRSKKKGQNSNPLTTNKLEDTRNDDENHSDDDEPHVECILPSIPSETVADFYCEGTSLDHSPHSENNIAKMTVLKVLDDILRNVFIRLGVQDDEFTDFTDAVTVKSRGESLQKEFGSTSVDTTRSADDIEVAAPALMPNKVNTKVSDDATSLTHRMDHGKNHSLSSVQSQQQLWTSRSRRQTLDDENQQTHPKRSRSSGDRSMSEKRSQVHPNKIDQPTPRRSSGDDTPLWPSSDSPLFPQASQNEISIFDGAPLCLSGALDGWNSVASQKQNETSVFTDLLKNAQGNARIDREQANLASSTAASIASSREHFEDAGLDIDGDCVGSPLHECAAELEGDGSGSVEVDANKSVYFKYIKVQNLNNGAPPAVSSDQPTFQFTLANEAKVNILPEERIESPMPTPDIINTMELSPTISSPPTPPPRVSPILVSLADLGKLREEAASGEFKEQVASPNPPTFNSLPKIQAMATLPKSLTPSLSRDDLRSIDQCRKPPRRDRDDHHTMSHRQVDALLSYRNVVAQPVPRKPPSLTSYDGKQKHRDDGHPILGRSGRSSRSTKTTKSGMWPPGPEFPNLSSSVSSMPSYKEPILNKVLHLDVACARSEGGFGLDGVDDVSHCNVIPRAQTDDTMTKDGATTISSVHSSPETEQLATLKEERNSYRDMCLTLGAENAKLRNLLASKTCTPIYHPAPFAQETMPPYVNRSDQQLLPTHNGFPNQLSTHSIVAMSDAGIHRGDYDSLAMSEDGTDNMYPSVVAMGESQNSVSWQPRGDSVQSFGRRTSGGGTYAESETSLEHNAGGQESHVFSGLHRVQHQDSFFEPIPLHGIESRLSKDITRYMQALKSQLKKNEPRRLLAVEGITKIVEALWPRAQIKMYGSHETKLCLPSSDMDFVISLPAVHKNAPATAPGDLEGRNAIIETNQKVLARRLKSEYWLDQRSIKVIERTAVPVIKVSTKDSRSRVVQLDLSFDAKEHHGLEALTMIRHILEQLPMVRPLVLVLKQFLLDRGLLTAYTGGLSSYCLFLMVARYCQEQAPSWNDCGSLLMGLLDFYGNFFDPRITGISVRTRQYFFRSQEAQHSQQQFPEAQGWNPSHQNQFPDLTKRNSFSSKPHRHQPLHRQVSFQSTQTNTSQFKSGKFDPIWVEDPLNPGNNVGRNAFRIFQVQRAFSDAHRALVASLEWDINSEFGDDGEYPLLKCLLQNEDVFFAIDDPIHLQRP